jgi:hypothetical protein
VRKQCDEDSKEQLKLQLDGLEKYLAKDRAKGFTRDDIFEILIKAAAIYVGRRDVENRRARLGELLGAAPPASFLELLKHERSFVICSLAEGPSSQEMQRAAERYRAIMGDLEKVAAVLPDPPPARSWGKAAQSERSICTCRLPRLAVGARDGRAIFAILVHR